MTYGSNLFSAYYNAQHALPAGYRRVEYIESSGVQWIDTGVLLTGDSNAHIVYKLLSNSSTGRVFGDGTSVGYIITTSYGNATDAVQFGYGTLGGTSHWYPPTSSSSGKPTADTSICTVSVRNGMLSISNAEGNSYTASLDAQTFTCRNTAKIFGAYYSNNIKYAAMRLYALSIQDVRFYVPVVRLSDSKPGLYDLCGSICPLTNSPFYVNSGTGADFNWGEFTL